MMEMGDDASFKIQNFGCALTFFALVVSFMAGFFETTVGIIAIGVAIFGILWFAFAHHYRKEDIKDLEEQKKKVQEYRQ